MAQRADAGLDRKRLVAAAFAQLEEVGLEGLQAPALYWHLGDKAELLGLMARDIYAAAYADVPPTDDWREWLRGFGRALHRSFAAHRDGALLCAIARPASPADPEGHAQRIAAPLVALGLNEEQALARQAAVISFALGWTAFETNGPMHDYLDRMMDFDATFAGGLEALVRGFG
jgi:TetR/AcrR family transcriptional regulator, tetracycline repressor protein